MVSINYSAREVCCKIVYYGPGLSGKTTNLQYIHSKVPQDTRGKLISLATEADRTLYFDFLPINIGTINDFQAKFQLYTVPGQVYYNATRKLVLRGVDGLVFVADSQADKMDENIESLANLEDNLREYAYDINQIPLVLQYNKRDLPGVLSVDELNARLNPRGLPYFEASAPQGKGVFDTLKLVIKLVLDKAKSSSSSAMAQRASTAVPPTRPEPTPYPTVERVPATLQAENNPGSTPVPVAEPVGVSTGFGTSAKPLASNSDTHAGPAPAVSESSARPYPGSDRALNAERRPAHVGVNSPSTELPAFSLGKNMVSERDKDLSLGVASTYTPQMAPSLRRRGSSKKRGFFKRLIGIK
jgi:signal recognition particle receptor subunit beta